MATSTSRTPNRSAGDLQGAESAPAPLVVDLADVTFIDSSAIAMMVNVHRHADALGVTVAWTNPRRQARQVMRITGVDKVLFVQTSGSHLAENAPA